MCDSDSDEPLDSRLSHYRVTASVSVRTEEISLAAGTSEAGDLHEGAVELVAGEFKIETRTIEILEVDELDGECP